MKRTPYYSSIITIYEPIKSFFQVEFLLNNQTVPSRSWAFLYWPEAGTDDHRETILFLVDAPTLAQVAQFVSSKIPQGYVLCKWVSYLQQGSSDEAIAYKKNLTDLPIKEEPKGVQQFVYNIKYVMDKTEISKDERAIVEKMLKTFEAKI